MNTPADIAALVVAIALAGYLVVTLLFPDRF